MAITRHKGEGSIYQRADGMWVARLPLPPGSDGKRKSLTLYARSRSKVLAKLDNAKTDRKLGAIPAPGRSAVTVGDLLDEWLAAIQKPGSKLKAMTVEQYRIEAEVYVRQYLGKLPIAKLDDERLTHWQDALLKEYAPRSVLKARTPIAAIIMLARRKRFLFSNPLELVKAPSASKPKKRAISGEEAGRFLRAIRGHQFETLFLADLLIGARRGELLGLRWCDLDLEAGTVRLEQQLQRIRGRKGLQIVSSTKSAAGERRLPLPRFLLDRFQSLEPARQVDADLVFTYQGKPIDPRRFNREFKTLVEAVGLAPLTPHELRHSLTSVLIALGVPPAVVAQYLGHEDPSVTLLWYTHTIPESLYGVAAKIDEYAQRLSDEHGGSAMSTLTSTVAAQVAPKSSSNERVSPTLAVDSQS